MFRVIRREQTFTAEAETRYINNIHRFICKNVSITRIFIFRFEMIRLCTPPFNRTGLIFLRSVIYAFCLHLCNLVLNATY